MRILAVSDQPSAVLWGSAVSRKLAGVDLILSCGDLDPDYLSYLVTFSSAPLLYVPGNHDGRYVDHPPEGCRCVDGKVVRVGGLRILGLGGSIRYNGEGPYQYTQGQMRRRAWRLGWRLPRRGGFDLLLTHSPAAGISDGPDYAHQGFQAFRELLERYQPPCFVHGHTHLTYSYRQPRITRFGPTLVINAYERCFFDL